MPIAGWCWLSRTNKLNNGLQMPYALWCSIVHSLHRTVQFTPYIFTQNVIYAATSQAVGLGGTRLWVADKMLMGPLNWIPQNLRSHFINWWEMSIKTFHELENKCLISGENSRSTSAQRDVLWACRSAVFTSLGPGQTSNFSFGSLAKKFGNHWCKQ